MAAYSGYGATLGIGGTYTVIAQVRDISGPSLSTDVIDTSSRAARFKTFVPGLSDGGEVTFDLVFDPDITEHGFGTGGLIDDLNDGTLQTFKLTLPDATPETYTFSAVITKIEIKTPLNDAMTADVTLKVSGAGTWA